MAKRDAARDEERKAQSFEPREAYRVGDAGPQRPGKAAGRADVDEIDQVSSEGDVYKVGDAGPPRPSSQGRRADVDAPDEVDRTARDVYKIGDAGPQRPGRAGRRADVDEITDKTAPPDKT